MALVRHSLCVTFVALAAVLLEPLVVAETLAERFHREYSTSAQKLEEFYSSCRMTATKRQQVAGLYEQGYRLEFARRGMDSKFVATTIESRSASSIGSKFVGIAGNDGAYNLCGFPNTNTFIIEDVDSPTRLAIALRHGFMPAFSTFCILQQRLVDLLQEQGVSIVGIEPVKGDTGPLVKVDWKRPNIREGEDLVNRWGSVVLSPDDHWAIQQYEYSIGSSEIPLVRTMRVRNTFGPKVSGMPVPNSVAYWIEPGPELPRGPEITFDQITFDRTAVSSGEFALSAFGLEPPRQDSRPVFWLVLSLGVVQIILLAILIWRYLIIPQRRELRAAAVSAG